MLPSWIWTPIQNRHESPYPTIQKYDTPYANSLFSQNGDKEVHVVVLLHSCCPCHQGEVGWLAMIIVIFFRLLCPISYCVLYHQSPTPICDCCYPFSSQSFQISSLNASLPSHSGTFPSTFRESALFANLSFLTHARSISAYNLPVSFYMTVLYNYNYVKQSWTKSSSVSLWFVLQHFSERVIIFYSLSKYSFITKDEFIQMFFLSYMSTLNQ